MATDEVAEVDRTIVPEEKMKNPVKIKYSSGGDRLCDLPDDVLLRIMSFLPVDEAVRTAAISRRWRRLPPFLQSVESVDLDPIVLGIGLAKPPPTNPNGAVQQQLDSDEEEDDLLRIVQEEEERISKEKVHDEWVEKASGVLRSHNALIRRCRIVDRTRVWSVNADRCVNRWMNELARKGIQSLTLETGHVIRLPETCFPRAKSLTSLQMVGLNLLYRRPIDIGCTAIRTLKLVRVMLQDKMLASIMSVCVQIQTLHLDSCIRLGSINIVAPNSLRCLRIKPYMDTKNLHISTPNLTTLSLRIVPWIRIFDIQAPQLKVCLLHVPTQKYLPNHNLIGRRFATAFSTLTNPGTLQLQLGGPLIQCLCSVNYHPKLNKLPGSVANLRVISLGVDMKCEKHILFVISLLECCSTLRELLITSLKPNEPEESPCFSEHRERWEKVTCIGHSLQKVEFLGIMAEAYELDLTKFILENAKILKRIELQLNKNCGKESKAVTTKTVVSYNKASPRAKVVVKSLASNQSC